MNVAVGSSDSARERLLVLVAQEYERQAHQIQLIASENLPSEFVVDVLGHYLLQWKTAEGLPGARYHSGCSVVDEIEALAQQEVNELYGVAHSNVQVLSSTIANQAILRALVPPNGRILAMDTRCGGHISHRVAGVQVSSYYLDATTLRLDYDQVRDEAIRTRPHVIIAGTSSYSRRIEFSIFREIANETGALLLVDCSHVAGLVAAGLHPSPIPHAHAVVGSTYKTLRGPRSAFVLFGRDDDGAPGRESLAQTIDAAIFPGAQSSPNMWLIAAKAACFIEARSGEFAQYATQVVENAAALSSRLAERGWHIVSGGTDTHLFVVDVSKRGLTGVAAETALEAVGILSNRNLVPFDSKSPRVASGVRFGTAFATSRGLGQSEMQVLADVIDTVLVDAASEGRSQSVQSTAMDQVAEIIRRYPLDVDGLLSGRNVRRRGGSEYACD